MYMYFIMLENTLCIMLCLYNKYVPCIGGPGFPWRAKLHAYQKHNCSNKPTSHLPSCPLFFLEALMALLESPPPFLCTQVWHSCDWSHTVRLTPQLICGFTQIRAAKHPPASRHCRKMDCGLDGASTIPAWPEPANGEKRSKAIWQPYRITNTKRAIPCN